MVTSKQFFLFFFNVPIYTYVGTLFEFANSKGKTNAEAEVKLEISEIAGVELVSRFDDCLVFICSCSPSYFQKVTTLTLLEVTKQLR